MKMLMVMAMVMAALGLSACETLKGVGRDVSNAGEAMDRTF